MKTRRAESSRDRNWLASGVLLLLLCAGLSKPAKGQCRDSDFVTEAPVAAASRPTESSAPDPIQVGVTEVEMGYTHAWLAGSSSQNVMSSLVKLGVWCNIELRWSATSFVSNGTPGTTQSGFGDNYLASQYRFHRETKQLPSMAAGYAVKFPSGNPVVGLGSGSTDHLAMLMMGKNFKRMNAVANVNYFAIGQGQGQYDHKAEVTLDLTIPVKGRWGAIAEVYYDSHLNRENAAYVGSTWGVTYTRNARLVFDGGVYAALSHGPGAPSNTLFVGVSYAVGTIYHRPPKKNPAE